MNYNTVASLVSRVVVIVAAVLIALGLIEAAANVLGYTFIHEEHKPSHLIELGAALTVIVIALLLRQIRDQLRKTS
jgi:drug/metabolite transporter (DMT)-like permease